METVPGGSTSDWGKYIANMKEIEKRFKDTGERQTVLLENWGIKLAHKFLVEVHVPAQLNEIVKLMEHVQKPTTTTTTGSETEEESEGEHTSTTFAHADFTLEGWPVPETWNDARQSLLDRGYTIRPLDAYIHQKDKPIRPSRYERKLKGALAHVSFIVVAYRFAREKRIRFSALARRIIVLARPASTSATTAQTGKRKTSPVSPVDAESDSKKPKLSSPAEGEKE
ncbi:hypothetical protein JOM56_012915 [Amanita muscaria]